MLHLQLPSPLTIVQNKLLNQKGIKLYLKRDDLIHAEINGNKWRKIKYNLEEFSRLGDDTILTFGGAFSNHIRAVAACGKEYGFKTIGVIRGNEFKELNPVLTFAQHCGMYLHLVDRETYQRKYETDYIETLHQEFGDFYLLPEGGSNEYAVRGCAEIVEEIKTEFDTICCPVGTGGTLAGIVYGLNGRRQALGFAALKGAGFLNDDVNALLSSVTSDHFHNWEIKLDYHFGGYAKRTPELLEFITEFAAGGVKLDYIYNGKMMYGLYDLIKNTSALDGQTIIAVITGGLQNASIFD